MQEISKLSGAYPSSSDGEMSFFPTFDIHKIYKKYYKLALTGKITKAVLIDHQEEYENKKYAWVLPTKHEEIHYEENKQTRIHVAALDGNVFDFFNPLIPLINRFALFAALSDAYLKTEDHDQALAFVIRAAQVWGQIDRFETEYLNRHHVELNAVLPVYTSNQHDKWLEEDKRSSDAAKGGKAKGMRAVNLAKKYWSICKTNPQYELLAKKHSRMGRKFSDELFEFLKNQERLGEIETIPYGASWFYENVTLKYRHEYKK